MEGFDFDIDASFNHSNVKVQKNSERLFSYRSPLLAKGQQNFKAQLIRFNREMMNVLKTQKADLGFELLELRDQIRRETDASRLQQLRLQLSNIESKMETVDTIISSNRIPVGEPTAVSFEVNE